MVVVDDFIKKHHLLAMFLDKVDIKVLSFHQCDEVFVTCVVKWAIWDNVTICVAGLAT